MKIFSRRVLCLMLAAVLVLGVGPVPVLASGACPHHETHTDSCGYQAPSEGKPCKYDDLCDKGCADMDGDGQIDHARDCAYTRELHKDLCDRDCQDPDGDGFADHGETCAFTQVKGVHQHGEKCGYTAPTAGKPCAFQCEQCAALTVAPLSEDPPEKTDTETTAPQEATVPTTTGEATVPTTTEETTVPPTTEEAAVPETTAVTVPEKTPAQLVQELIAALPEHVTGDNRDAVTAQLQEILALFTALTEEEQEQVDITPCVLLQGELDEANQAELLAENRDVSKGNVVISADGDYTITGSTTTNTITVGSGVNASITLDNVSIEVGGTSTAFKIADNSTGNVTVTLVGTNTLKSGKNCAGLQKGSNTENVGTLTITGTGSLTAQGGERGAGIGGGSSTGTTSGNGTNIVIGGGTITAKGGNGGAGIGGGSGGTGTIVINGGDITANGDQNAAGIGGGSGGTGTVTIRGGVVSSATGNGLGAGIGGGGWNSGTVIIEGGTVNSATGGGSGGAGIGSGNGSGVSGTVTITGGDITAEGGQIGAGIGGGEGSCTVNISGSCTVHATGGSSGGAGIGGSSGTVTISGGNITANGCTGYYGSAGIGGGFSDSCFITISGGTVTATGINGIGDGKNGTGSTFSTDPNGNAWIVASGTSGTSISDRSDSDNWSGVIISNNEGKFYNVSSYILTGDATIPSGATLTVDSGKALTIGSGATLTNGGTITNQGGTVTIRRGGSINGGTINGSGTFQTGNLTENDIVVPEDLVYNGSDQSDTIRGKLTLSATICGQAFEVTGWGGPTVTTSDNSSYTVTYTPDGDGSTVTKTVTLGQSGTEFVGDGAVKTYKDNTEASEFTYGDTITVKAKPTPTGEAPATMAAASRLRGEPNNGQMALYFGGTQVSGAASAGENGLYTMTVTVKDLIAAGAGYDTPVTLTAKFVGNDCMADGEGTVEVTLKKKELTMLITGTRTKTYDGTTDTNSDLAITLVGIVPNEDVTATASYAYNSPNVKEAYLITATDITLHGETAGNYTLPNTASIGGKITKSNPAIAFNGYPATATYSGTALENPTEAQLTISDASYNDVEFVWTKDGSAATPLNAGTYTLTATIPATDNTNAATATLKDITITPKAITVKADDKTKTYGDADPALTYTAADLVTGESLTGITLTRDAGNNVKGYTITASQADGANPNYTITFTTGTLTIEQLEAELVWSDTQLTYNGTAQAPTATVGNLVSGDSCDVTVTGAHTNAGKDYTATATALDNGNYQLPDQATTTFAIAPKEITVTITPNGGVEGQTVTGATAALDESKLVQGDTAPTVTLTYTKEGETAGSATVPTAAGTYTVTATIPEGNYVLKGTNTAAFIVKRAITVTVAKLSKTYGDPDPKLTYTVTTGTLLDKKPLNIQLIRAAGEDGGKTYPITAAADTAAKNPSYEITVVDGTLTINKKDIGNAAVVLGPALTASGKEQTQTVKSVTVKNSKGEPLEVTYTVTGNTGTKAGGYEMTITGTGNFTGTKKQSFAIAPGAGQPVDTDGSGNPVLGGGKITGQVSRSSGAPETGLGTPKAEIVEMLTRSGDVTAQELAAVADGAELKIVFPVKDGVSADDKAEIKALARGYTIGSYFDITMYKQLGDGEKTYLHKTGKPITMMVRVPESLLNKKSNVTRTFWVVRCHGDVAEFLKTQYDDGVLTFQTDQFSGYAIVYKDSRSSNGQKNAATGTSPATGDSSHIELWIATLAISAVGIAAVLVMKRKKKK